MKSENEAHEEEKIVREALKLNVFLNIHERT